MQHLSNAYVQRRRLDREKRALFQLCKTARRLLVTGIDRIARA
jgi:hypothetical protein